ncbi:bifunctional (p)ppGpp synthetase/guanosine-3',5'-bis(diphosphate) 3'-pyrophosphohydrolase [Ralstonia pickettii]|nr:bifunctional (p)ppGpp synthetase/guanosine-3',5'-bis(diphosphate) 3'-pyrophosphohydrolase [Ralstonia pickettii]
MKMKAKQFAEKAHEGQFRKSGNIPYITHPIRVARILERAGASDALVSAGYLHDVVEDTPIEIEEIEKEFGTEIANLVRAHTEDKSKSWQKRKQHTIDTLRTANRDVKQLIVADRLDNLLSIEKDLQEIGPAIWDIFNAGIDKQKWYNEEIVKNMKIGLNEKEIPAFFEEFANAVAHVFS